MRYLVPRQSRERGLEDVDLDITENAMRTGHPPLHQGERRAEPRARDRAASAARSRARCSRTATSPSKRATASGRKTSPSYLGVPKYRLDKTDDEGPGRPDQRPGVNAYGGDDSRVRGRGRARQGQAHHHRQARQGHAGARAGRHELRPLAPKAPRPRGRLPLQVRHPRSLPRASCPRTARAPASPWPPASPAPCSRFRSATTSP